jgi:Mg/Co/Ni transporter MgtE
MLDKNLGNTLLVYDIMEHVNFSVSMDDDLAWVTDNFERHGGKHLPVCSSDGLFKGFVSKNTIFTLYRKLSKNSDEF